jgi:hypothetical protein
MRTAWSAAGRGGHEGADGVERIGGHRSDDEHGEQAVPQLRQPARTMSAKAAAASSRQGQGEGPGTQTMSPWIRAVRWPTRRGICQLGTTT